MLDCLLTPRSFGNPFQTTVHDTDQLVKLISDNEGKAPVYVSHNSYVDYDPWLQPTVVRMSKMYFDLDDAKKPEHALTDLRKLIRWSRKEHLPHAQAFSGVKGFQFYLLFVPTNIRLNQRLSELYVGTYRFLKKSLGLKTLDFSCADPKRICRVWGSRHVSNKRLKNGQRSIKINDTFCLPLDDKECLHQSFNEILKDNKETVDDRPYSEMIKVFPAEYGLWSEWTDAMKFRTFCQKYSIKDYVIDDTEYEEVAVNYSVGKDKLTEFVKSIIPRPCLHNAVLNDDSITGPQRHKARFTTTIHLKRLSYDRKWILDFFQSLGWSDFSVAETCSQLNHIFDHRPHYRMPSCSTIKKWGLCVGKVCPKYRGK